MSSECLKKIKGSELTAAVEETFEDLKKSSITMVGYKEVDQPLCSVINTSMKPELKLHWIGIKTAHCFIKIQRIILRVN